MTGAHAPAWQTWLLELERIADEIERRAPAWLRCQPLGIRPGHAPAWLEEAASEWGIILAPGTGPRHAVDLRFARRTADLTDPSRIHPLPGERELEEWRRSVRPERLRRLAALDARVAEFERRSCPLTGGGVVEYWSAGAGPVTLVVWNALDQDPLLLRGLLALLTGRMRVITWQPRAAVDTLDACSPEFAEHESDLHDILAHEGIARAHLAGWCTGGKACLRFAARHPERVASLALLQPALRGPETPADEDSPWEREMAGFAARLLEQPQLVALAAALLSSLQSDAALTEERIRAEPLTCGEEVFQRVPSDVERMVRRTWRDGASAQAYLRRITDFWRHPVQDALEHIAAPVLIVSAEHDRVATPRSAERARRSMRRAPATTHWIAQDADHYFAHQEPFLAAAALEAFLAQPGAPAPPHAALVVHPDSIAHGVTGT